MDGSHMDDPPDPQDPPVQPAEQALRFRHQMELGTYTIRIWVYAFQGAHPWTEYNPDNNSVTLTYGVGYWP